MSGTPVLRILIKLSGEALAGAAGSPKSAGDPKSAGGPKSVGDPKSVDAEPFGIDPGTVRRFAQEVKEAQQTGAEVALVLGGGNLFRGAALADAGLGRVTGDHMGMLATVMNALAFRDVLQSVGVTASVLSAVAIPGIVDGYAQQRAVSLLAEGQVVLFAAGTGNPFFTTDSAACLRGIEVGADLILKATKVDGVYSADPVLDPQAQRFDHLGYDEVISRDLKVMDLTAICLCRDHQMPLRVLDVNSPGALARVARGEAIGTLIDSGSRPDSATGQ